MKIKVSEIRKMVEDVMNEMKVQEASTTANAPGYQTPNAFAGKDPRSTAKRKKIAAQGGLSPVRETQFPSYTEMKKNEELTPRQKFGIAVREVRNNIRAIEEYLDDSIKLKTENGVTSNDYWKRTHGHLAKVNEDMLRLMGKIRELRG